MTITEELPAWPSEESTTGNAHESLRHSDYELAQKAATGDTDAFEQIYLQHHRRVYGLCLRMMRNTVEAEDLTQELFTQLFKKIGSFRGDSAFTTWLHRMTVNQVLMHFRRKGTRLEQTTADGELPVREEEGLDTRQGPPALVDRIALERAMAQLPPGYLTVFILHDVEGFEHEEIARLLGCAAGTSKSQLHKARMKLRNLLRRQAPHAR